MAEVWWHLGRVLGTVAHALLCAVGISLAALVKAAMAESIIAVARWTVTVFGAIAVAHFSDHVHDLGDK